MPVPMAQGIKSRGLISIVSNSEMVANEKAIELATKEQNKPELLSLASHIETCWQAAKRAKVEIETRLIKCARQRKGDYDAATLAKIKKHGGSEIFMQLTKMKCRAAKSWIKDIMVPPGEKPWSIEPTPVPDLPDEIEQNITQQVMQETVFMMEMEGEAITSERVMNRMVELKDEITKQFTEHAKEVSTKQERQIEDDFVEGKYYEELERFINDFVTFPAAFMRGPISRKRKALRWEENQTGQSIPKVTDVISKEYNCVSPFDAYPSPGARNIQDGYFIERDRMRRRDLISYIGTPGANEEAIRAVLAAHGEGGIKDWLWTDQERADIENRPGELNSPEAMIDALIFWGNALGQKLLDWGMSKKQVPDPEMDYQITAIKIGRWIILARLNPHPLGHRPYYASSFEKMNNSIWNQSIPELMEDIQKICNATARNLINNEGIASGPQVEVHKDRIQPGEDVEDIYPWKIWQTKSDDQGHNRNAVNFYQPSMNVEGLLKIYDYFFKQASEVSGIPAYIYGSDEVGGAGKTASGLSMLMNAASKTLKDAVGYIDTDIVKPTVREHWLHLMLYNQSIEKTGDINIIARASEYLIIQEQLQARRTEFLTATDNPTDLAIMGLRGRATVLREAAKNLKLPDGEVVPSKKDMQKQEMQQMLPPPEQGGTPGNPDVLYPDGTPVKDRAANA